MRLNRRVNNIHTFAQDVTRIGAVLLKEPTSEAHVSAVLQAC